MKKLNKKIVNLLLIVSFFIIFVPPSYNYGMNEKWTVPFSNYSPTIDAFYERKVNGQTQQSGLLNSNMQMKVILYLMLLYI